MSAPTVAKLIGVVQSPSFCYSSPMFAIRYWSVIILIVAVAVGFFVWATTGLAGRFDFKLGLDLKGGTHLVYDADTSKIKNADIPDSLSALRTVVERRVNAFGVGEPVVETQQGGALGTGQYRLIVELPGITDVNEAVKMIGATPVLEFKLVRQGQEGNTAAASSTDSSVFEETGLTGAYLSRAVLQFGNGQGAAAAQPVIRVDFNSDGAKLFGTITSNNVGA